MGRGGFWPEDDGTEKEFGGWEGREVADKCWGRGEEGGQDPSAAWLALQGGWLCAAGSWPAEKGSAAEENSGEGGHCSRAQLGAGSGHALGDTVTLAGMQNGETIKAHGSAPLQYLKSLPIGVPMHTVFCQRESPQPQTSGYFLPAVGLQVC